MKLLSIFKYLPLIKYFLEEVNKVLATSTDKSSKEKISVYEVATILERALPIATKILEDKIE